jgi:hypothetical protein
MTSACEPKKPLDSLRSPSSPNWDGSYRLTVRESRRRTATRTSKAQHLDQRSGLRCEQITQGGIESCRGGD